MTVDQLEGVGERNHGDEVRGRETQGDYFDSSALVGKSMETKGPSLSFRTERRQVCGTQGMGGGLGLVCDWVGIEDGTRLSQFKEGWPAQEAVQTTNKRESFFL